MSKLPVAVVATGLSFFAVALMPSRAAGESIVLPATYYGYAATDRWGQSVFHSGPYHVFLSDDVAEQLAPHRGKPLELEVKKASQPESPGGVLIQEIGRVEVKGIATGLKLAVKTDSDQAEQGRGVELRLSLRNDSREPEAIFTGSLAVVLVTRNEFAKEPPGHKDPEGRGFWYYRDRYIPLDVQQKARDYACHETRPGWTAGDLIMSGRKIGPGKDDSQVIVEPGGIFETSVVVGKELLPGQYQAFFCVGTGNLSGVSGPMSERVSFDVIDVR